MSKTQSINLADDNFVRGVINRKVSKVIANSDFTPQDHSDLVQEVYVRATKSLRLYDPSVGHLYPFVCTVVERHLANVTRERCFLMNLDRRDDRLREWMQQLPQPWPFPDVERFAAIDGQLAKQLKAWIVTRKAEAIRDRTVAGGKYPHLCRFANHLYEALGSSLRIIAVDRPIEASIRSLQDRSSRHPGQWFAAGDDACDKLQRSLMEHREMFIQEHPEVPVHRINFAKLTEDPETAIKELIAFLGIEPTAEEIDSAIAHVNPQLRKFG